MAKREVTGAFFTHKFVRVTFVCGHGALMDCGSQESAKRISSAFSGKHIPTSMECPHVECGGQSHSIRQEVKAKAYLLRRIIAFIDRDLITSLDAVDPRVSVRAAGTVVKEYLDEADFEGLATREDAQMTFLVEGVLDIEEASALLERVIESINEE